MATQFTPVSALLGGALIGLSVTGVLLLLGRIAGVSGILGGVLFPVRGEIEWRWFFLAGLLVGGWILRATAPHVLISTLDTSLGATAAAGLLVGFGTRLGGGCTSGHGVCGMARLSRRSVVATAVFMATGGVTVYLMRHWGGQ